MKTITQVLMLTLILSAVVTGSKPTFAQDNSSPVVIAPTQTFSINANAIALPGRGQTVAATIIGGSFAITDKFSLRQDNVIAASNAMNGYYGGFQYQLPSLSKKLNTVSTFDASQFSFYITASAGVDHVGAAQHYSFLAGGGVNYGSGKVSYNLVELRWLKAPGFANNVPIVSSGVKFGF